MEQLIEKISSYNIFNYLLPGVLFAIIGTEIASFNFIVEDLVIAAFVYYFYGLIISRVGSLVIEPFLKFINFVNFSPYSDYVEATKKDSAIETLSEQNNSYRSMAGLFLSLLLLALVDELRGHIDLTLKQIQLISVSALLLLFLSSYRKQTKFISDRVSKVLKPEDKKTDIPKSE